MSFDMNTSSDVRFLENSVGGSIKFPAALQGPVIQGKIQRLICRINFIPSKDINFFQSGLPLDKVSDPPQDNNHQPGPGTENPHRQLPAEIPGTVFLYTDSYKSWHLLSADGYMLSVPDPGSVFCYETSFRFYHPDKLK